MSLVKPLAIIGYFDKTNGILFSNSQWPESYERYSVGNKYYEGVQDIPHEVVDRKNI